MSSPAPDLPSSGWRVLYRQAFEAFFADAANLRYGGPVSDWIISCREHGPPEHGIDAGDDYHVSEVPGTPLIAEYLVIEAEYLVIIKRFLAG